MDALYPPLAGILETKSQALNSAADALRNILNKLPIDKEPEHHDDHKTETEHIEHDHKPLVQYEIPSDPPPFKPLKVTTSYGVPSGSHRPIDSITHTQIITTAYGAPSQYQKPPTETDKWNIPIGPGVSQSGLDTENLNMYHIMSLKNSQNSHIDNSHNNYLPPDNYHHTDSQQHNELLDPRDAHNLHQQQQQQHQQLHAFSSPQHIQSILGPAYELQKSVGYELRGAPIHHHHQHHPHPTGQRRQFKLKTKPKQLKPKQ